MKPKIYIDGQSGTTGLQIYDRIGEREDLELLLIDPEKRHDVLPHVRMRRREGMQQRVPERCVHRRFRELLPKPRIVETDGPRRTVQTSARCQPEQPLDRTIVLIHERVDARRQASVPARVRPEEHRAILLEVDAPHRVAR